MWLIKRRNVSAWIYWKARFLRHSVQQTEQGRDQLCIKPSFWVWEMRKINTCTHPFVWIISQQATDTVYFGEAGWGTWGATQTHPSSSSCTISCVFFVITNTYFKIEIELKYLWKHYSIFVKWNKRTAFQRSPFRQRTVVISRRWHHHFRFLQFVGLRRLQGPGFKSERFEIKISPEKILSRKLKVRLHSGRTSDGWELGGPNVTRAAAKPWALLGEEGILQEPLGPVPPFLQVVNWDHVVSSLSQTCSTMYTFCVLLSLRREENSHCFNYSLLLFLS